jgi:thiamine pyrophosphate-dependent acetolactate synthase large subunit-like protein
MLDRIETLKTIVAHAAGDVCLISPLGYITRDLFSLTPNLRERCFYCMGSMGSVVPLALGVSLARPSVHVFAIEGDGSLLMNLGALATLRRYARGNISLLVFDNRCYESTGGQPSQADNFKIEDVCRATGLVTYVATHFRELEEVLKRRESSGEPAVLVIKVGLSSPSPRVSEEPELIADRFAKWLESR